MKIQFTTHVPRNIRQYIKECWHDNFPVSKYKSKKYPRKVVITIKYEGVINDCAIRNEF